MAICSIYLSFTVSFCFILSLMHFSAISVSVLVLVSGGGGKLGKKQLEKKNFFFWFGFGLDWNGLDWPYLRLRLVRCLALIRILILAVGCLVWF